MKREPQRMVVARALLLWEPCILTGVDDEDIEALRQRGWTVRSSYNFTDFSYTCTPPEDER